MKILVTGGAGYIGSFITRELADHGFEVVIVDSLESGHREAVKGFEFYRINLLKEKSRLVDLFKQNKFIGVVHMASYIQMGESFKDPGKYFENNLINTLNILECMVENKVSNIVFSSSAGVYGNPKKLPIEEDDEKNPLNPYGETKLMNEKILGWFDKAYGIKNVSIRYFNAAGASLNGSLGEDHPNESHLIPLVIKASNGGKMSVYGDDYNTSDGSCVRDYVHVIDLAQAHYLAMKYLLESGSSNVFNAGAGRGYSNFEIIKMVEEVSGKSIKVEIGPRRAGDADNLHASIEKIQKELGWKPKFGLREIVESAYKWHTSHPNGFEK